MVKYRKYAVFPCDVARKGFALRRERKAQKGRELEKLAGANIERERDKME